MKQLYTPTDKRIIGTYEVVPGCALASSFELLDDGKLDPVYAGETKLWWDEQRTVTQVDDMSRMPWSNVPGFGTAFICHNRDERPPLFVDEDDEIWRLKDLEIRED